MCIWPDSSAHGGSIHPDQTHAHAPWGFKPTLYTSVNTINRCRNLTIYSPPLHRPLTTNLSSSGINVFSFGCPSGLPTTISACATQSLGSPYCFLTASCVRFV